MNFFFLKGFLYNSCELQVKSEESPNLLAINKGKATCTTNRQQELQLYKKESNITMSLLSGASDDIKTSAITSALNLFYMKNKSRRKNNCLNNTLDKAIIRF